MLFLSVAQIEIAMQESKESVEHLISPFTTMMSYENIITNAVDDLPDTEETRMICQTIKYNTELITHERKGADVREAVRKYNETHKEDIEFF